MNAEEKTNNVVQLPLQAPHEDCAVCGSGKVNVQWKKISFEHGTGKQVATLHANIPVHKCQNCHFEFTGQLADRICHEEVCRHLKVPPPMRPDKLLQLRNYLDLTPEQLAEVTGIGVASINSWEKGSFPQSPAMDGYLFLVGLEGNLQALSSRQLKIDARIINFQDQRIALEYLQEASGEETLTRKEGMRICTKVRDIYGIDENITEITTHHYKDLEVVEHVASLMEERGRIIEAAQLLKQTISRGRETGDVLVKNLQVKKVHVDAQLRKLTSREQAKKQPREQAREQAREIVNEVKDVKMLSFHDLLKTVRHLKDLYPEALNSIGSWKSIDKLDLRDVFELSRILSFDRRCLDKAEILIRKAGQQFKKNKEEYILSERILLINLIGQRKFDEAVQLAENILAKVRYETVAFHLAMAKWGLSQEISIDDFEVAVASEPIELLQEPHFFQVMSLVYWVLGDEKCSLDWLQKAEERVGNVPLINFSSWTYLFSEPQKFQRDLKEQESMINGKNILPRVFSEQ